MQDYWDLTNKQRAALTADDIEHLLDVELMRQGLVRPKKPELETVTEVAPETEQFYGVAYPGKYSSDDQLGVVFDNEIDALQVASMTMYRTERDYRKGDIKYAAKAVTGKVVPLRLPGEVAVTQLQVELEQASDTKKKNEALLSEYNKATKAVDDALKSLLTDWRECQEMARQMAQVRATCDRYLQLCDGDNDLAAKFLAEAYDEETLTQATEWYGGSLATPDARTD